MHIFPQLGLNSISELLLTAGWRPRHHQSPAGADHSWSGRTWKPGRWEGAWPEMCRLHPTWYRMQIVVYWYIILHVWLWCRCRSPVHHGDTIDPRGHSAGGNTAHCTAHWALHSLLHTVLHTELHTALHCTAHCRAHCITHCTAHRSAHCTAVHTEHRTELHTVHCTLYSIQSTLYWRTFALHTGMLCCRATLDYADDAGVETTLSRVPTHPHRGTMILHTYTYNYIIQNYCIDFVGVTSSLNCFQSFLQCTIAIGVLPI